MLDILPHEIVEVLRSEVKEVIEAFRLNALTEPLDIRVGIRRLIGRRPPSMWAASIAPSNACPKTRSSFRLTMVAFNWIHCSVLWTEHADIQTPFASPH
jgi:hypothetical protein